MGINVEKLALGALAVGSFAAAIIIEYMRPKSRQDDYNNMELYNNNSCYDGVDPFLIKMVNKYCPNNTVQNRQNNMNNVTPLINVNPGPNYNYGYNDNINYNYCSSAQSNVQPNIYYNSTPVMQGPITTTYYQQPIQQPQAQTVYYQQPLQQQTVCSQQNTYGEFEWEDEVSLHPTNMQTMNSCQTYNSNGNGFSYYNNDNITNSYNYQIPYAYGYDDIPMNQTYNSNGNGFSYYNNDIQNGWYQNDYAFQEQMRILRQQQLSDLQNQQYYQSVQQYQQPNIMYDTFANVQQSPCQNPFEQKDMTTNQSPQMGPFKDFQNNGSFNKEDYQSHSNVTDVKHESMVKPQSTITNGKGVINLFGPGFI